MSKQRDSHPENPPNLGWGSILRGLLDPTGGSDQGEHVDDTTTGAKRSDEWAPTPRTPGLWMARVPGVPIDHAQEVESARAHLVELLCDPYYREAFGMLASERHPILKMPRGRAPAAGTFAAKVQIPKVRRRAGRHAGLDLSHAVAAIDRASAARGLSQMELCRRIVRKERPDLGKIRSEAEAKKLAQRFRNERKKAQVAR